jgi:hypothetical protein
MRDVCAELLAVGEKSARIMAGGTRDHSRSGVRIARKVSVTCKKVRRQPFGTAASTWESRLYVVVELFA